MWAGLLVLVPEAGYDPARLSAINFKFTMSTNSITRAFLLTYNDTFSNYFFSNQLTQRSTLGIQDHNESRYS